MRYIGIDPGDRWCGIAELLIIAPNKKREQTLYRANMAVFDADVREFAHVAEILTGYPGACYIVEEYRQRPAGHQAWNIGLTQQRIGAIRYVLETRKDAFCTVRAGNALVELPKLVLGEYIAAWAEQRPRRRDVRWHHAYSAWRVLARHLLEDHPDDLLALRQSPLPDFEYSQANGDAHWPSHQSSDLIAPTVTWELP